MSSAELWAQSAGELADAIARREVTSVEVVQAHLDRIEAVNDRVNAVTRVLADDALQAAQEADRTVLSGAPLGALHGVPFTVKENIDVVGSPTTQGVPALVDARPAMDAPIVERLRAAGAIPLARTNLPDLALRVHTDSSLHGVTANPFDPTKTAGGSSGGEAAAIACGLSPLGLGTDIGGSLRIPAYCCGIASLKPSTHRVAHAASRRPHDPFLAAQLMAVDGPMARRVADVRTAFRLVARAHPRDPFAISAPFDGPALESPPRVALAFEYAGRPTAPTVVAAVQAAGAALADAGYEVVEAVPPLVDEAIDTWVRFLMSDITQVLPVFAKVMSAAGMRFLEALAGRAGPVDVADHMQLMIRRHEIARQWSAFFEEHPMLVSPVWPTAPFDAGWDTESDENALATFESMRFVTPVNILGLPAAAVPTGLADGLPVGVQVVGNRFREDLCLAAAEAIEVRLGTVTPVDPR